MAEKVELTDKQKKGCFGCLGIVGIIFIILVIVITVSINNTTKDEKLTEDEIAVNNATVKEFEDKTVSYIEATNGVVKEIQMKDVEKSDTFNVDVYINEASWAKSTESEKASVAATISRQMEQLAGNTKIYVSLKSYENRDTLASPKITQEGYKIIR